MQKDKTISDMARRVFEAIKFQDPAELEDEYGCYIWGNGFSATFKNGEYYDFRVYNRWDGTQTALMAKYKGNDDEHYYQMPETTVWHFDGNKAEKINFTLPVPEVEEFQAWKHGDHSLNKSRLRLNVSEKSIQYEAQSAQSSDGEYENPELFLQYAWNGEKFVNELKYNEYVAFRIWETLKPKFEKEFGLNSQPEVSDGCIYIEQGQQNVHVRSIHYFASDATDNMQDYKVYVLSDDGTITNDTRTGTYSIEEYFFSVNASGGDLRKSPNGIQPALKEYEHTETLCPVIEGNILKIIDKENDNNVVAQFKFQDGEFVK